MKITELVERYKLSVHAPGIDLSKVEVDSVAAIDRAGPGNVAFFTALEYAPMLSNSKATAIIVREPVDAFKGVQLIHKDPKFIFAKLATAFYEVDHGEQGVHATSIIDPRAKLGEGVRIHARVVVESGAEIGDGVVLYPGVYVGRDCKIGKDTVIHANVVLYYGTIIGKACLIHAGTVLGADGFGFTVSGGEICKIPQTGIVRIGNDVEMGALCTVDRAASHETIVGDNCKFDDRVHIGHNVVVGANTMISAQVGVGGSTVIGEWNLIGGQAGIADHMRLPDRVQLAAKTGVITNLPDSGVYAGFPAIPLNEWKRSLVYIKRMKDYGETVKQLRALEQKVAKLEAKVNP